VLVLPGPCEDDPVARPAPLPEPEAGEREDRGVGGKDIRGCPGIVSQSQVGEAVCPFH